MTRDAMAAEDHLRGSFSPRTRRIALLAGPVLALLLYLVLPEQYDDGQGGAAAFSAAGRATLPLGLRLDVFEMSLEDVVKQCHATGIVSQYLIHQTERAKGATLGKPLHPDMITRKFSAELAKLGLEW